MTTFIMELDIEAKEEVYEPGVVAGVPTPQQAASRLNDILADTTKHDEQIGWRVTRVSPIEEA